MLGRMLCGQRLVMVGYKNNDLSRVALTVLTNVKTATYL